MQVPLVEKSATLECPECGKHTVVSPEVGVYKCLNCDFERNLNSHSHEETDAGIGKLIFACAGFLITCALLL